ncbi:MAG: preprotein translocase subunit SecD [Candidatus Syntrophoarchaeum sp. WYZ-LMO15]|nr:MAG: preprotein translocase subunit SecD [Candidatus Syntrophoarchaeum sp. WYZ-LMO15]
MKGEIFRDWQVVTLIVLVLASVIAIHPVYSTTPEPHFETRLKYGLDLVGGTSIQLELEGALVKVNFDRDTVFKALMEEYLNSTVTITSSTDDSITFTTPARVTTAGLNSLGFGEVTITPLNGSNEVVVRTSPEAVMAVFLQNRLDTEVIYTRYHDTDLFEIRKEISEEELKSLLKTVNATIASDSKGNPIFIRGVTPDTARITKQVIDDKLNTIGLKDIHTRTVGDRYIIVDLPGVDIETARAVVGRPGKFEVRIQTAGGEGAIQKGMKLDEIENITAHVFYGAEGIASVDLAPSKRGREEDSPWGASFHLTQEGGKKLREAALKYGVVSDRLNHEVVMLLDNEVIYSAPFAEELARDIVDTPVYSLQASTGPGDAGFREAQILLVHLRAGALPVNVKILGVPISIPAPLGEKFRKQVTFAGIFAMLVVGFVVYLRYRQPKIVLPMIGTMMSEVVILLGFASMIKWQLDLASIAAIIAVIGTSVDQLVIITDEVLGGGEIPAAGGLFLSRLKSAFTIIFAAAATTVVAMTPLVWMGFGALKGFAIITIAGVLIGVIITRPAYGRIIQHL